MNTRNYVDKIRKKKNPIHLQSTEVKTMSLQFLTNVTLFAAK